SDGIKNSWYRELSVIVIFGTLAGASVGAWTGGLQPLYVAIKVPVLLIGSLLIGLPSMSLLGRLIGCPLNFSECAYLALSSIARTSLLLGSLAPATAFFALSLPAH